MVNIAYATPPAPPLPRVRPWRGMKHKWTGWDGTEWDITDPKGGVFLTAEGLEGIDMPEIVHYTHSSPVVHGESYEGFHIEGRKVQWFLYLYHDESSEAFIHRDRAFWRTMRPGKSGLWTVELPTGESRTLRLRYKSGIPAHGNDPAFRGWVVYPIEFLVEQPLWEGLTVIRSWDNGEQVPLIDPALGGPPFNISPYQTIGTATVSNTGDDETFVKWTVIGPTSSVQVGVGGRVTVADFPVPDGSKLVINTDPRNFEATLDGVNVFPQLGAFEYEPLPPGENIQLSLAMTGTGTVQAEFPTLHFRVN